MTETRRTDLRYLVVQDVVADGETVPSGDYAGHKIELGVRYQGQLVWQKPEYILVFPSQGGVFLSAEVSVTKHISSGAIVIL